MSELKPHVIALWVEETLKSSSYVSLYEGIFLALSAKLPEWSDEKRAEEVEKKLDDVRIALDYIAELRREQGFEPAFVVEGEPGAYYIKSQNELDREKLKSLLGISPKSFEEFCKRVLDALGGVAVTTGGVNDGGIDFVAEDLQLSGFESAALKKGRIALVGQAKRYKVDNLITLKDVREFIGAAALKADILKREKSNRYGLFSPIILAFWTTSDFTKGANEYANQTGVWMLSGIALSQLSTRLKIDITDWFPTKPPNSSTEEQIRNE